MRKNYKYIRYFSTIFLLVLFVIMSSCLAGQTTKETPSIISPSEIIKNQFEQQASKQLGLPVKVSEISMGYSSIELTGISIGEKSKKNSAHAEIEKISAVCNFMSLLSGTLEITELTITSSSFTISRNFIAKLSKSNEANKKKAKSLNEFPLNILKGKNIRFHIVDPGVNETLHITLPELSLVKSASKDEGTLILSGRMSAGSAPISFNGNLVVTPSYPYLNSGNISLNKVSAKSCFSIVNNILNNKLTGTKVTQGTIEASVKLKPEKANTRTIKLWFKSKDLTFINKGIKVSKLSLQTTVGIPVTEYMDASAQININNGSIVSSKRVGRPITNLKGKIDINSKRCVVESLSMNWGKSAVKVAGSIQDFNKFNTNLTYTVNPFDLNDAGEHFLAKSPYKVTGVGKASGKINGPFSKLIIDGDIKFPNANLALSMKGYNQPYVFPFINVSNSFTYSNGLFNINKVSSSLFGGQVAGTGKVFMTKHPIQFKFNAAGNGLRAEAFLSSNSTQKNVVTGPLNLSLNGSGNVNGLNTWNGNGKMSMTNGQYSTPPVVSPILSALNLKEFSSGIISTANGNFNLVNGILHTNDLNSITDAGKGFYKGSVGLDTSLNGKMNLTFAENAVNKSQILREISRNGKTVSIPTKVRGTLLKPIFPGFKATKLLELGLKRKGEKMLQDLLFGKQKNESNTPNQYKPNDTNTTQSPKTTTSNDPNLPTQKKKSNSLKKSLEKSLEKELKKLFKF